MKDLEETFRVLNNIIDRTRREERETVVSQIRDFRDQCSNTGTKDLLDDLVREIRRRGFPETGQSS